MSDEELSSDIPDCDPFFSNYGPSFELTLNPGRRPNMNSSESVDDILEEAFSKYLRDTFFCIHQRITFTAMLVSITNNVHLTLVEGIFHCFSNKLVRAHFQFV